MTDDILLLLILLVVTSPFWGMMLYVLFKRDKAVRLTPEYCSCGKDMLNDNIQHAEMCTVKEMER